MAYGGYGYGYGWPFALSIGYYGGYGGHSHGGYYGGHGGHYGGGGGHTAAVVAVTTPHLTETQRSP
jgi:hypothetical protein